MPDDANAAYESRVAGELAVLRALCGGRNNKEQTGELVRALAPYCFVEPEHQVIFESIRAVRMRPEYSASLLAVHLNNRGFPDLDLETYFVDEPPSIEDAVAMARGLISQAN